MNKTPIRSCCAALLLAALPALLTGCPKPLFSENVVRTSDLVYGAGYVKDNTTELGYRLKDLHFDLVEPTDGPATLRPAVLMIHGGTFLTGSKNDENLVRAANGLATEGYVCFLIDYRLDGDNPPVEKSWQPDTEDTKDLNIPSLAAVRAAFVDAKTAMRHIRANSSTYGIDPDRIAVWGESAGAFAALAAGLTEPGEFEDDGNDLPIPVENNPYVNPKPSVIIDCWGSSVFTNDAFDADDPPVMIFHGKNDKTISYLLALNVKSKCEAAGIPYRFYGISGGGHGCWDCTYKGRTLTELTLDFLADFMP